jgi:hypothetical protein
MSSATTTKGVVVNVADSDNGTVDAQCCTAHNLLPMVAIAGAITNTTNHSAHIAVGGDESGSDVLRLVKCDTAGKFVDVASTALPDAATALAWRGDLVRIRFVDLFIVLVVIC